MRGEKNLNSVLLLISNHNFIIPGTEVNTHTHKKKLSVVFLVILLETRHKKSSQQYKGHSSQGMFLTLLIQDGTHRETQSQM